MIEWYEALEAALEVALLSTEVEPKVFVCLSELYRRGLPTFLPWYDYNRICCDQCYHEILRDDRCSKDWRCSRCVNACIPLDESRKNHDRLCVERYREMIDALYPMVQEEIRQRKRVSQLARSSWGISEEWSNESIMPRPPVD